MKGPITEALIRKLEHIINHLPGVKFERYEQSQIDFHIHVRVNGNEGLDHLLDLAVRLNNSPVQVYRLGNGCYGYAMFVLFSTILNSAYWCRELEIFQG